MISGDKMEVASVYGGVPLKAQANEAKAAHVIVATPGRLQDLVDRNLVSLDAVQVLVLDEADRMLDMGFKPQVDRLGAQVARQPADDVLLRDARRRGRRVGPPLYAFPGALRGRASGAPQNRQYRSSFRAGDERDQGLHARRVAERRRAWPRARVRAHQGGADRLVEKLRRNDVDAVAIHGDKGQAQREQALAHFDTGKVKTLVATDVAARGLDVDDITHVINFDPPEEPDVYTHRVGRTGRAGKGGVGITLVLPEQQADVSRVARLQGHVEKFQETGMQVAKPRVVYTSRRREAAPSGRAAHRKAGGRATRGARRARRPAP